MLSKSNLVNLALAATVMYGYRERKKDKGLIKELATAVGSYHVCYEDMLGQTDSLTQDVDKVYAQNRYLVSMLDKHGVPVDDFDLIVLQFKTQ